MTGYEFGDIVLVPFSFFDLTATKKRPAAVISSSAYHRNRPDLIILARAPTVEQASGQQRRRPCRRQSPWRHECRHGRLKARATSDVEGFCGHAALCTNPSSPQAGTAE
jgi:hypothetical protein